MMIVCHYKQTHQTYFIKHVYFTIINEAHPTINITMAYPNGQWLNCEVKKVFINNFLLNPNVNVDIFLLAF